MGCGCSRGSLDRSSTSTFALQSIPLDVPSVLLLGLDGVGKSSLFYRLKIKLVLTTQPTTGYNVDVFSPIRGLKFTLWDIGGQTKLRKLWSNYFAACRAVIFMVDSSDALRFQEARNALHECISHPAMPEFAPIMVLANKQDEYHAASPEQISSYLDLHQIAKYRECKILGTSVVKNIGVMESMSELKEMIQSTAKLKHWDNI